MAKKKREINFKPNYLFYWMWYRLGVFKNKVNPQTGQKGIPVFPNLGGTRCFYGEQRVITNNGSVYIKDLVEGDMVLSYNHKMDEQEYKMVRGVAKNINNTKKCLKITLKNGEVIKCTEDHKIFLNGRYETAQNVLSLWKQLKDNKNESTTV